MILSILVEGHLFYYWVIMLPLLFFAPMVFWVLYNSIYRVRLKFFDVLSEWSTILLLGWVGSYIAANLESFIYSLKYPIFYKYSLSKIFEGQRFYGSLLFGSTFYIQFKKEMKNYFELMDIISITLCFALVFGKIACFVSAHTGCAGVYSTLPWACVFKNDIEISPFPQHPKQVYDAIFYFSLFIFFLALKKNFSIPTGLIFLLFIILLPLYLFIIGFISAEKPILLSFRLSHFFAMAMLLPAIPYIQQYKSKVKIS